MSDLSLVTLGGGSGHFALLSALRDIPNINISAVVSMTDSGGSTGVLRDELGALPPGDILKCILALSPKREVARDLLLKRFQHSSRLQNHNAGNLLLTMLHQYTGSFSEGVSSLAEILNVRGEILPVTTDKATLVAELTNGQRVYGEHAIDIPRGDQREKIANVFLVPHHADAVSVYPPVLDAIAQADYILMGPGDLYTSLLPNLLVPEVAEALQQSKAKLVYISNIMTKFGETEHFQVEDFVKIVEGYARRKLDWIIFNQTPPSAEALASYSAEKSELVMFRNQAQLQQNYQLLAAELLDESGGVIRHNIRALQTLFQQHLFA